MTIILDSLLLLKNNGVILYYEILLLINSIFTIIDQEFALNLCNVDKIKHSCNTFGRYPVTIGTAIPLKASFFITYIMVDGWASIAAEVLMLKPLIVYHLKNFFLVKTEKDREEAMDPGSIGFNTGEPRIQLYFLLGLVYAAVTPAGLPFIIVFFGLAYLVFRHQVQRCKIYSEQINDD